MIDNLGKAVEINGHTVSVTDIKVIDHRDGSHARWNSLDIVLSLSVDGESKTAIYQREDDDSAYLQLTIDGTVEVNDALWLSLECDEQDDLDGIRSVAYNALALKFDEDKYPTLYAIANNTACWGFGKTLEIATDRANDSVNFERDSDYIDVDTDESFSVWEFFHLRNENEIKCDGSSKVHDRDEEICAEIKTIPRLN